MMFAQEVLEMGRVTQRKFFLDISMIEIGRALNFCASNSRIESILEPNSSKDFLVFTEGRIIDDNIPIWAINWL